MNFRKATKNDIPGIFDVMCNTGYRKYVLGHLNDTKAKKSIEVNMRKKDYIVAEDDGKIIGYSIFDKVKGCLEECPEEINQKYAYSRGIGIHSDYRGRGIATELYKATFKFAKKKYKGFYADVDSDNDASIRLHKKAGFKEVARYKSKIRKKQSGVNVVFAKEFKWYNRII